VPDVPESDAAPPSSALGLRLERHADTLDAEARRQEDVDARNNAISLWKAAAAMRTAARLLG
jgi:hypothetical protein